MLSVSCFRLLPLSVLVVVFGLVCGLAAAPLCAQLSPPIQEVLLPKSATAIATQGSYCAVALSTGEVMTWNSAGAQAEPKALSPTLPLPANDLTYVGERWLVAAGAGQLYVWDAKTGIFSRSVGTKQVRTLAGKKLQTALALSPDGKTIALGYKDRVQLIDTETWLMRSEMGLKRGVALNENYVLSSLAFSPDGRMLVWGVNRVYSIGAMQQWINEGEIYVFNTINGSELKRVKGIYKGEITDIALSPDGRIAAVAESNFRLRLIEVLTGDVLSSIETKHGSDGVKSVSFVRDSPHVLLGGADGFVTVVDYTTNEIKDFYQTHSDQIIDIALDPDGFYFYTASFDGSVKKWDVERREGGNKDRPRPPKEQDNKPIDPIAQERPKKKMMSDLYLLTIGISKYKQPHLNLTYCDKDARAIAAKFSKMEGKIFGKVDAKTLVNEEATFVNMRKALSYLKQSATSTDLLLIHVSSHGALDNESNLYVVSHDFEGEDLFATGLKVTDIIEATKSINCKVILLLDACHSGASGYNLIDFANKKGLMTMNKVASDIYKTSPGLTLIVSSSGSEFSLEREDWGHGAFTKALLEGLDGKADFDGDKVIRIAELNLYISRRVKELTDGKQHPFTPINQFGDIPLYVID